MKASEPFMRQMDAEKVERILRYEIDQLRGTIAEALIELRRPLDTEAVLDTHAGRALWGSWQAGKAVRILARTEPHSFGQEPADIEGDHA